MTKKLSEASLVTSLSSSQSVLVEADGSVRRIKMADLKEDLASAITTPPTEFTLEQSSSPAFEVSNNWAAYMYRSYMGGYMFRVIGGKVYAAKLNSSDWNYFDDGSKVDDASKYETMVHVPTCHFKADGQKMQFGGLNAIPGGHSFDSPNWVGAYQMYVDSNNVGHSRPDVSPSNNMTMSTFWQKAQNLNTQFGLANYQFYCLINALYQATYGNLNSQSVIGLGFQNSNWEACRNVNMGLTRSLGDGSGSVLYNDSTLGNQYPVKLFGFEDLWGKLWEFRPGIRFYMDGTTRYAVVYSGNQVSNTATGRTFTCISSASGNFVTKMQLDEYWDMIPQAIGGANNTYYCDAAWASTSGELLRVGGSAYYGLSCGVAFSFSNDAFSASGSYFGARLAFYGEPVLVSGTELMAMG